MVPCIEASEARSVTEIGAYNGGLTRLLADWAARVGGKVVAIDPAPKTALVALERERDEVRLVRETSLEALGHLELTDVVILDGEHNYWTVSEELRLLWEHAPRADLPLLMLHDVGWPHAFRDDYFDPSLIPQEHRHPIAGPDETRGLYPGDPGLRPGGLPYPRSAAREGGPRNGVRAAVQDFVEERPGLGFARVPAFFGFGVVWHEDAPWAESLAGLLEPWDENPVIERLEANRVRLLADLQVQSAELWKERERRTRQEALLRRLIESSAFALAEWLSRLRIRAGIAKGQRAITRDEVRRVLSE
jgi:hypothetical protein